MSYGKCWGYSMALIFDPEIVPEYRGLELIDPNLGEGSTVFPLRAIGRLPLYFREGKVIEGKFRTTLRWAYFGNLAPADGGFDESGVAISNGYHRLLTTYLLCGKDSYFAIRSKKGDLVEPDTHAILNQLDELIVKYGLREVALHELGKVEQACEVFDHPWRLQSFLVKALDRGYLNEVCLDSEDSRRKKVLTTEHIARLKGSLE